MGTKDAVAPSAGFDFSRVRTFKVGPYHGAVSYLQILASELSDKLLREILELDAELTVTMHIPVSYTHLKIREIHISLCKLAHNLIDSSLINF